jgi:hypothetical protein
MNNLSIAPCGVICDLCKGFQREKNKCVGCNYSGNKPYHCTVCSIKSCLEKKGNDKLLCSECTKYPCQRIRDLNKRYIEKYGESPIENMKSIIDNGISVFIEKETKKWTCLACGKLLCVHSNVCLSCGVENKYFPLVEK